MVKGFRRVALAAAITLLLQSCGAKLSAVPANGTILAFGDSLTAGYGASEATSYPSALAQISGRKVINAGISGEVTQDGLARLPQVLDQTDPDLLILLEGGNDILQGKDLTQTKQNLAGMIELAQSRGIDVVLVGVPKKGLSAQAASFYEELAKEYNLVYEDDLIGSLLRKTEYKSDAVHFNAQGYSVMAQELYELLDKNGAL